MEFLRPALAARRGRRRGRDHGRAGARATASSTTTSPRKSSGRARAAARACTECPVSIDQLDVINELRRNLVLTESRFPEEMQPAFESLERNGSPWAFQPADRARVGRGAGHPDDGGAGGARRAARHPVLGRLHGLVRRPREEDHRRVRAHPPGRRHPVRDPRAGGELPRRSRRGAWATSTCTRCSRKGTIETLDRYEVTTIVTHCPHCFHQIGNEFPQLGGNYEVIHHSTYIERLLAGGPRAARRPRRATSSSSPTTTAATSAATTTSTTRRARRSSVRCPVVNLVEPARSREPRPVLRRRRRAHVDGGAARASASTSSAPRSCSRPAPTRSPWRARSA